MPECSPAEPEKFRPARTAWNQVILDRFLQKKLQTEGLSWSPLFSCFSQPAGTTRAEFPSSSRLFDKRFFRLAPMKSRNSGCGSAGFD